MSLGRAALEGAGMEKNPARAREYWELGVKSGSAVAQNNLALLLAKGLDSNPDEIRAISLFRGSAQRGDPPSQIAYALSLLQGIGVARDAREGFRFMEMAAKSGNPEAQNNLEACYFNLSLIHISRAPSSSWTFSATPSRSPAPRA